MSTSLQLAVFVGIVLVWQVAMVIVIRRIISSPSPRAMRKWYPWFILNHVVVAGPWVYLTFYTGMPRSLSVVILGGVAVSAVLWLYATTRPPDEEDAQRNFAHDSRHYGRCGYDLTGNLSGTCPECGWRIPKAPM